MKKLAGQDFARDSRMPPSVETSAMPMLSRNVSPGRTVRRCAAAAGVITSVSTRRTPTTWIASAVVSATSRKIATESAATGTPPRRRHLGLDGREVELVLVVPTTWAEAAQQRLRDAGYRNGPARLAVIALLDEENCCV